MHLTLFLIWMVAYSFSLATAGLMLYLYLKTRDLRVFAFSLILANMTLTCFVSLTLSSFIPWGLLYRILLINVIHLYNLSVPFFIFSCLGTVRERIKLLLAVWAGVAIAVNIATLTLDHPLIFILLPLCTGLMAPLLFSLQKGNGAKAARSVSLNWNTLEGTGFLCMLVIVGGSILFALLMSTAVRESAWFAHAYFAFITLLYLVPPLRFAVRGLMARRTAPASTEPHAILKKLSPRETEVARLICQGLKYQAVADALFISLSAVKKHAYSIYRKTGIKNNRQLMQLMFPAQTAKTNAST